ncbi:sulfotransferase family cytosolic 1B member 1-like protein [Leptotrombidium deliense]|uniref:Sulfotransferase family cytosolic 1B member 1-like protein n=1 Tax=Leptotrombidium deliense TaxID=299467 RepID=A0A443SJX6_9ACAR|nr:sulfotransferase family cytosolic 1B member 1-like protein [Leptotrombidium deliense]
MLNLIFRFLIEPIKFVKVIYIVRNPKDQLVSYYHFHQTAKYLGGKKWDWNSFLHLFKNGQLVYGSWSEHVQGWWTVAQKHRDKVLVISYEELHEDIAKMVKKIADFVGVPSTDDFIKKVKFIRKGVVGDWKNYFTPQQEKEFDDLYAHIMSEIVSYKDKDIHTIETTFNAKKQFSVIQSFHSKNTKE